MNLPNCLSIFRLLLVPAFAGVYLGAESRGEYLLSAGILLLSGCTDVLDGWIARHYNMVTKLGKILDPLADKLTQITVFVCLAVRAPVFLPLAVIFIAKEAAMLLVGFSMWRHKYTIEGARWFGKLSTVAFYLVVFSLILFPDMDLRLQMGLVVLVLVLMLFSLCMYIPRFVTYLRVLRDQKHRSES